MTDKNNTKNIEKYIVQYTLFILLYFSTCSHVDQLPQNNEQISPDQNNASMLVVYTGLNKEIEGLCEKQNSRPRMCTWGDINLLRHIPSHQHQRH